MSINYSKQLKPFLFSPFKCHDLVVTNNQLIEACQYTANVCFMMDVLHC